RSTIRPACPEPSPRVRARTKCPPRPIRGLGSASSGRDGRMGTDDIKGRAKEAVGDITDNDDLKREGKIDQVTDKVKEKVGEAADKVKDLVDRDKEESARTAPGRGARQASGGAGGASGPLSSTVDRGRAMPSRRNRSVMRPRNSRATAAWRRGAVLATTRMVRPSGVVACTPQTSGSSSRSSAQMSSVASSWQATLMMSS